MSSPEPNSQRLLDTRTACLLVSFAALLVLAVHGTWAVWTYGPPGLLAASVAAAICWGPAVAALTLVGAMRYSPHQLAALLASIGLRTGVPVGLGLGLIVSGHPLLETGLVPCLIASYLSTLAVETVLVVRMVPLDPPSETAGSGRSPSPAPAASSTHSP